MAIKIGGVAIINDTQQINVSGMCTASAFHGAGTNLTSIPAGQLTGTVDDARITTLTASKLSGALPAIDGSALTGVVIDITSLSTLP